MKTYKATYDNKCLDFTYRIGKTYTHNGPLIPCQSGFHSCPKLKNVFKYYIPQKNIKVYECEIGNEYIIDDDKIVSRTIKLVKEIKSSELKEWMKFDLADNLIYRKLQGINVKEYFEYDEKNNLIHETSSDGYEIWYEYDENNNQIYKRKHKNDIKILEEWKTYDENNNCIIYKDSNGLRFQQEFDENNNMIEYETNYH